MLQIEPVAAQQALLDEAELLQDAQRSSIRGFASGERPLQGGRA